MEGHVKVSGTWKALEGVHVKVSGTWKEVKSAYIKVSGTWKQWYQTVTVLFDSPTYNITAVDSSPVTSGVRFNEDGTIDGDQGGGYSQIGTWTQAAVMGADYQITSLSGGAGTWTTAAAADDTAISLAANREWTVTRVGFGVKTTDRDFKIELIADASDTDTSNFTCESEAI